MDLRLLALASVIAAIALSAVSVVPGRGAALGEDDIAIPEVIFRTSSQAHCVYRATLVSEAKERRQRIFLNFMNRALLQTKTWQSEFALAAIDYAAFKYFYVITYSECSKSAGDSIRSAMDVQNEFSDLMIVPNLKLVSFAGDQQKFATASEKFIYYRSRIDLQNCIVELTGVDLKRSSDVQSFLMNAAEIYRMSIADVSLWNDKIYVVFGRQCDQKKELYESILLLASQNRFQMSDYLSKIELNGNLRDYLRASEGGTQRRPR